jgi:chlorite dismutase
MVTCFRRSFDALAAAQLAWSRSRAGALSRADDVVRVDRRARDVRDDRQDPRAARREVQAREREFEKAFDAEMETQRGRVQNRLWNEVPPFRYVCFYPMNKRRGEALNWYSEPFERRAQMMREHGMIGRHYAGKVTQIISGSIGYDDWEWGVDLYAPDPVTFKKLIYEMRFDEASAKFAEFGPFYTGVHFSPSQLGRCSPARSRRCVVGAGLAVQGRSEGGRPRHQDRDRNRDSAIGACLRRAASAADARDGTVNDGRAPRGLELLPTALSRFRDEPGAPMTPQEAFVTRLRRHRQRNRISLEEIAAETRVKKELFEAFEANDLSAWPRGLYARAWVRTYACAVGLDPIDTVDEFCRLFPQGDRRGHATMHDIASIVATAAEFKDEFPQPERRRRRPAPPSPAPDRGTSASPTPPARGPGPPATCSRASPARSRPAAASKQT